MIDLLIISVVSFLFTRFLQFCYGNPNGYEVIYGRIFSVFGEWINKRYSEDTKDNPKKTSIYKVLICKYCLNFWVFFTLYTFQLFFTITPVYVIGALCLSHFFHEKVKS